MKPATYHWPLASTDSIALLQSLAGAGTVVLNGQYGQSGFMSAKISDVLYRQISITSANNLAGINFTITGSRLGTPIVEVLAGPNANTIYSVNNFDVITSITTNGAAAAFSVGTGLVGAITPYTYDYQVPNAALGIQTVVSAGTMNYTFFVTLSDLLAPAAQFADFSPIPAMTAANTDQLAVYNTPIRFGWFQINGSAVNDTLTVTFVQQGLT